MSRTTASLVAALICSTAASGAFAQNNPTPAPAGTAAPAAKAPTPGQPPAEKKPEPPKTIDELTKDFVKSEGVFTFYRKKEGKDDTLYMEIPESKLNKMYLIQATASTGLAGTSTGLPQGQPLDDIPVEMRIVDDSRVLFVRPVLDVRADSPEMKRTLERGHPVTILFTADIKARQKDRNAVLVDVGAFFKSDIAEIGPALAPRPGGLPTGFAMDPTFTYLDSFKVYPENVVVRTMYKLNRAGSALYGDPRAVPLAIVYSFSSLPDDGYRPRLGDPRVGFFVTSYNDLTDNGSYDTNVNFIERWNLEKADPNAPMSPPKKPIVWYIDNGIPVKYRDAVRRGLLMYNKAFEKIGIKDAIVVKQMPDDADWDIADVRYNIIRWTENQGYAVALFRAHPVTGEILNAAINMDADFARGGSADWDIQVDPRTFVPRAHWTPEEIAADEAAHPLYALGKRNPRFCDFADAAKPNFRFGMLAASLLSDPGIPFDKEKFVEQYITEVVAHEFGHCLGLRHNFIASTEFDPTQLKDPRIVNAGGIGGTVMDYNPFNIWAIKQKGVDYYSQTIGKYDYWAISYGYSPIKADSPKGELPALRKIASQGNLPGNAYRSDGLADDYDPRVSRFDLSKDPLAYVERTMDVSRYLLSTLDKRLPKQGESYYEFTRSFSRLLGTYLSAGFTATRYIGGIYLSDNYKGDANEQMPLTPVSGADQKRALAIVNKAVFSSNALVIPKKDLLMLAPNPNVPFEASTSQRQYPIYDTLTNFQNTLLNEVFYVGNLRRIVNTEYRAQNPSDVLTLATLFRSTGSEIWSELGSGKEITGLRRNLQRSHLNLMTQIVRNPRVYPADAVTLAWEQLRTLKGQITTALPKATGEYGKPHLEESLMIINRTMNATTMLN